MAINKVDTTKEEESFKFLKNQSSILHTVDTNKITVNGVNVIADKPKRGDVMCITKYKENGVLLDADKQEVVWIDGLSIEPTQLSQDLEPVGICLTVKGNKALVRYKEERSFTWAERARTEIQYSSTMNDGLEHSYQIVTSYNENGDTFTFTSNSREEFVAKLNAWFNSKDTNNQFLYSAELVELDSDKSAVDKSDDKDNKGNYRNRIVVNRKYYYSEDDEYWAYFDIDKLAIEDVTTKHIKTVNEYYKNNGFTTSTRGGCCRAKYYDCTQETQSAPSSEMASINIATGLKWGSSSPVRKVDFTDNKFCKKLRENFATYDEYFDSMMIKSPCGAGAIGEFPSGKENTYKLADGTFLFHPLNLSDQRALYPAAEWAASIDLNAPKLGRGNWWLPSVAEMVEIMRDITYNTSFWETNPDIINSVISKLTSRGFNMLSPNGPIWSSSLGGHYSPWVYYISKYDLDGDKVPEVTFGGELKPQSFNPKSIFRAFAVTIYEF